MAKDDEPEGHIRRRSTSNRDHVDDHVETREQPYNESTEERVSGTASGIDTVAGPRTVRFSEDVQRDTTPQRMASELASASTGSAENKSTPKPLSVVTGTADGRRSNGSLSSPPMLSPRSRGYSLRRAIFQRSMAESSSDGSVIELQETGASSSSASNSSSFNSTTPGNTDKKSVDTTITISAIGQADDEQKKKRGVGNGLVGLPNYESWLEKQKRTTFISRIKTGVNRARKTILRTQEIPPSKDGRHVPLDASRQKPLIDERTSRGYVDNFIRSCRYTVWNFLPRQLFAQFSKLANFYFLSISILQMIPGLSTTGTFTTIVPLLFFVSISMFKEGYDDYRRFKMDKEENNREALVLHTFQGPDEVPKAEHAHSSNGSLHWTIVKWHNLKVGDIVKMKRDEPAPADLLLLRSSGENNIAYVETMALDGETNLKSKQTTAGLAEACASEDDIAKCRAQFVAEDPNLDLYKFEGRVSINGQTAPLTNNEIIYRNSILRNTPNVVGMVIYSGEECKIRMNANKNSRIKAPHLQSIVNKIVIIMVIFVIVLALFNTIANQIWRKQEKRKFYLAGSTVKLFPVLVSFIIMFNTLIPLSLYVSMEIIKLIQMYLMNDIDMYDAKTDTPFKAQTSTINEELGQVSYVFSDKTGTLTDNEMKFRKISVAGTAWLHDFDLKKNSEQKDKPLVHKKRSKGKKPARKSLMLDRRGSTALETAVTVEESNDARIPGAEPTWQSSARPAKSQHELSTKDMIRYIQRKSYTQFARKARLFLLSIALCHTCLPEVQEDGTTDFQAASPDELALVRAAQELGYMIMDRNMGTITLRYRRNADAEDDVEEIYDVLDVIEFSSKRKRMSVIVRFPNKKICIMTKGADSVIMQRMRLATLASKKAAEIEARASKRRSMEAQAAIVRKSSVQLDRKSSLNRHSLTMGRSSLQHRTSGAQRLQPVRDELDHWLREREQDVDMLNFTEDMEHMYSPRQSAQMSRASMAHSDARSSMLWDDEDELVDESMVNDEPTVIERCFQHINHFATDGLRTLLYGYRFVSDEEYAGWKKLYLEASTSLHDRERKMEQAGGMIEVDLDLAGATAIEDKLQVGVPETIDKLRRANIKMWMLTGDKRETAINIGHSCRLIKDYSNVVILDHETGEVERTIGSALISINSGSVAHSVVVVDGQTLSMIEETKALEKLFYELAIVADSVICCRASPSQKARLVKGIRNRVRKSITLAIGDGANDIAMIQTAHVGIGITGKEGLQAARTSDYAIAQFRFLTKLLLVHGRWNYIRTCKYIVGTFWKEMLFYLTQALYQRWNGYTGTSFYENWSLSMFNTLFTSLPVIFMGAFEKDLQAATLIAVPELYTKGQRDGGFNFRLFLGWMFMASTEAMIVYFTMFGLWGMSWFTEDDSLFAMGDMTFTACIILISTKMQLIEMHNKSLLIPISMIASIGGWFLWNIILSATYHDNRIYKVKNAFFNSFGKSGLWWFTLFLILAAVVLFELAIASLRAAWFPTDADIFQELEQDIEVRKRFEEAAAVELRQGWEAAAETVKTKRDEKGLKKVSSLEIRRAEEDREAEREQERREEAVVEMLRNRPDKFESGVEREERIRKEAKRMSTQELLDEVDRSSADIAEMLSRRFGSIKRPDAANAGS